ncbi:MAG: tetratricopeptide repeat protein [Candidatus Eisenbacteria bacterium]
MGFVWEISGSRQKNEVVGVSTVRSALFCSLLVLCLAGVSLALNGADTLAPDRAQNLLDRARAVRSNDPHLALELCEDALGLAKTQNLPVLRVRALIGKGVSKYFMGEYTSALIHYQEARELAEGLGNLELQADVLNNIGILHFVWGEYDQALDYYIQSLAIRRELGDETGIGRAYNNIANIYQTMGDYDQALDHYGRSLEIYESQSDTAIIASSLNNIGLLYYDQGEYDRSLGSYSRALALESIINDKAGMALTLNNMGQVFEALGTLDEAMEHYERSLSLRREIDDRQGISVCLHNIGVIHVTQESYDSGIDYLERALGLAEDLQIRELIRDDLESLAIAHEAAGDYERALAYYKRFKEVQDELFGAERTRQIALAQTRFEVDLKDREIQMLKKETEIERFRRQLLLVVAGLALIIILLLLNRYMFQRRAHSRIAQANEALRIAHDELGRATRDELAHVSRVTTMGELAAAFAHELNQPLAAIRANARAGHNFLDRAEPDRNEACAALIDIGEDAERAQDIIVRLRDMMRKGEQKQQQVDLRRVLHDAVAMIHAEAERLGVGLDLRIEDALPSVVGDRIQLQQVVLNLIQNGLAVMAGRDGVLTLTGKRLPDDSVCVGVTDSGPPVDDHILTDMFEPFFTTKRNGLGMGLAICRTIIESHGGSIEAERRETGGVTVSFRLPKPPHGSGDTSKRVPQ